jgi:predicted membrane-bound spermidine synthase
VAAYGALEAGVSLLAVAVTLAIPHLDRLLVPLLDLFEGRFLLQNVTRFGVALAVLAAPTVLLGATLPVLARGLTRRDDALGQGVARLYATNTAGAVAGVLAAGFVLIPRIGLRGTAFLGAAIGLGVAAAAVVASRRLAPATPASAAHPAADAPPGDRAVLVAYGFSGFAALALEVVVMRLLGLLQTSSTLAIASMLAVFLVGIALGSAFAARRADVLGAESVAALAWVEIGVGVAALLALWTFAILEPLVMRLALLAGEPGDAIVRPRFAFLAAAFVFLPPTLLLGATFPLAARAYVGDVARLGTRLGRLYGANTIGGVLGSFAAAFLLIPTLGTERSMLALALLFCAIGAGLALALRGAAARARRSLLLTALSAAAVAVALPPRFAETWQLAHSGAQEMVHSGEDYYATVAVVDRRHDAGVVRQLVVGGDFMSNTSLYAQRYMRMASLVPSLVAGAAPKSGLVICFGVGITTEALALQPTIERVTVVELSRQVLASAHFFEQVNHGILANPKVHAVVEDGRQYLLRHPEERFDVITLEPPPPAGAGVGNLYSRDFYEQARAHLTPNGVMGQWIPVATQTPAATRSLLRAFADVFPHVTLWWTESLETLLVGSDRPLRLDLARVRAALADPQLGPRLREIGIADDLDFASYYLLGDEELRSFAQDAVPATDDLPVVEYGGGGSHDKNWRVIQDLLSRRPTPAAIAQRFGLAPSEAPELAARLEKRVRERLKVETVPSASVP